MNKLIKVITYTTILTLGIIVIYDAIANGSNL